MQEELRELPSLKEKLANCAELKNRLIRTEQWRERAKKRLEETAANLDKATGLFATIGHAVSCLIDTHAKLVHENQFLNKQVLDDIEKYNAVLEVARIYKMLFEKRAKIPKDWLRSDDPEAVSFLGSLTTEMMDASTLISDERYRLAVTELGMDYDTLSNVAKGKGTEDGKTLLLHLIVNQLLWWIRLGMRGNRQTGWLK